MVYSANIPQPGDRIKDSQPLILANFQDINTWVQVNHVGFVGGANDGKHNYVSMPEQAANPATAVNEAALFVRQGTYSGVSELCFRRENNGNIYEASAATLATPGWTFLPSGLLLKWGTANATGLGTLVFPAGGAIPAFNQIFNVQVTTAYVNVADGDGFVRVVDYAAPWTSFRVFASHRTTVGAYGPVAFDYLAIGY